MQGHALAVVNAGQQPTMQIAPSQMNRDDMDEDPEEVSAAVMSAMLALHQARQRASRVAAQAKRNRQRTHPYQIVGSESEASALPIAGGGAASSSGQVIQWATLERDLSHILDQDDFEGVPLPFLGAPPRPQPTVPGVSVSSNAVVVGNAPGVAPRDTVVVGNSTGIVPRDICCGDQSS